MSLVATGDHVTGVPRHASTLRRPSARVHVTTTMKQRLVLFGDYYGGLRLVTTVLENDQVAEKSHLRTARVLKVVGAFDSGWAAPKGPAWVRLSSTKMMRARPSTWERGGVRTTDVSTLSHWAQGGWTAQPLPS